MKNIVIVPNQTKDFNFETSTAVAKLLLSYGANVFIERKYATNLSGNAVLIDGIEEDTDLLLVIGGDGSVIDASVSAIEHDVPVLGVNLGNLGYLAEVETTDLNILERLFNGRYKVVEKMLLSASISSNEGVRNSARLAVNDVIISHESYVGLAELTLEDSNGASVRYRADGLILSTPVGSTAYSLSAGGPIVSHHIDSILVTPICPHSFFNRSVIFKPTETLRISNNGTDTLNITIDGRLFSQLGNGEVCAVKASDKKFRMITFTENNMFSSLFAKMKKIESI